MCWNHIEIRSAIHFNSTSQSHDGLSHSQVSIVTPTFDSIYSAHGPWTNGLWPGTLSLLALHAEQLQWIHFQLDRYSILLWLESVDGCCWWQNVVVICCYCWKPIYSNLWELKLATSLKFITYGFKADLFVVDSSGQALHDKKVTKCLHIQKLRDPSSVLFQKHSFHGDVQTIWILLSSVHILGGTLFISFLG